jgi:hypothetical protein
MPCVWFLLRALVLLIFLVTPINSQEDCEFCSLRGLGPFTLYIWLPSTAGGAYMVTDATITFVTIIDQRLDETQIITQGPPTPTQPTNENGTAVQTITYERSGENLTTTLTYPDVFFDWPEAFTFWGNLETTLGTVRETCVTVAEEDASTVAISQFPQPSNSRDRYDIIDYFDEPDNMTDTTGLSYYPWAINEQDGGAWFLSLYQSWFPDQAAVTDCYPPPGPHFGGFTQTYWDTISTTIFMNSTPTTATLGGDNGASATLSSVDFSGSGTRNPEPSRTASDDPRESDDTQSAASCNARGLLILVLLVIIISAW